MSGRSIDSLLSGLSQGKKPSLCWKRLTKHVEPSLRSVSRPERVLVLWALNQTDRASHAAVSDYGAFTNTRCNLQHYKHHFYKNSHHYDLHNCLSLHFGSVDPVENDGVGRRWSHVS
jgi:hypothetical protein